MTRRVSRSFSFTTFVLHWILHGVAVQNDGAKGEGGTGRMFTQFQSNPIARSHPAFPAHSYSNSSLDPSTSLRMTPSKVSAFSSYLPRAFSTQFHPHSQRFFLSAFLKTFYYFSLHDQIASYRASLRHGAIGLGSLHFALDAVHGAERFSSCALGYANYLQQQRRTQADAGGDSAEADGAGACAACVVLCEAQEGMWLQAGHRLGRFAVGSFAGHRIVREEDSKSRPDDACKSQAGVAAFRRGGLLDTLSRESHQVRPGRKRGGDAERCFKVVVRNGAEDVCVLGKTEGDVRRQSRAFHERDSG